MKQLLAIGIMLCALTGCGGGSGSDSRIVGTFTGNWFEAATPPAVGTTTGGTMTLVVTPAGEVTGQMTSIVQNGVSGPISGQIQGGAIVFAVGVDHFSGSIQHSGNTLTGNFAELDAFYTTLPTMTLRRVTSP